MLDDDDSKVAAVPFNVADGVTVQHSVKFCPTFPLSCPFLAKIRQSSARPCTNEQPHTMMARVRVMPSFMDMKIDFDMGEQELENISGLNKTY